MVIASGDSVSVTVDGIQCVFVRADVFDRVRELRAGDHRGDPRLAYPAILRAWDQDAIAADCEGHRDLA